MKLDDTLDPCTHCGACLSYCVWDAAERAGQPAGPALCRECQVCYRICPRLPYDAGALAAALFPAARDTPWGREVASFTARAAARPAAAQDGGLTTRLGEYLLVSGQVEAVLVTGRDADWRPAARWATTPAELYAAAGSKYATAPALAGLRQGLERFQRVAVVVLPCQAAALARLRQIDAGVEQRISLVIGLFCTESFFHGGPGAGLTGLVEARLGRPLAGVERFDIKRGRLLVRAAGMDEPAEWRMKDVHEIVWPICLACRDLTAELADLSIGSIGSAEGANTLIVRSERGRAAIEAGAAAGLWSLSALENAASLEKQSERKRGNLAALPAEEQMLYGRQTVRGNWKRRQRRAA
jgi:coenzyme F420 hydrogenase subunit beta